jgi:hypothetical protein
MPTTIDPAVDHDVLDAIASLANATDEGPDALDVSDEPVQAPLIDPSPKPDDGDQDVSQDPADHPAEV